MINTILNKLSQDEIEWVLKHHETLSSAYTAINNPETKFKVGEFYKYKLDTGAICVCKINRISNKEYNHYIYVDEFRICSGHSIIFFDDMCYNTKECINWELVDRKLYAQIAVLYKEYNNAIEAVETGFYNKIIELCQSENKE